MSKITLDNLSDNLKEYLEGLGLSEEQVLNLINENGLNEEELKAMLKDTMSINELSTNSKTVIGAINELFQSANNGKELIASAIGEPLSSEDTFSAMSNDINSLLSTFKTNMMNNGITVESSDRFKSLIDKIATMVEEGSGKGIQYAEGTLGSISSSSKTFDLDIDFEPTILLIHVNEIDVTSDGGYGFENLYEFCVDVMQNEYTQDNPLVKYYYTGNFKASIYFSYNSNVLTINTGGLPFNDITYYAIGVGEEDTTLRDSLASILTEEGVSVSDEDDMASLITKVDEEFDNQVVPAGTAVAANVDSGKTFINSTGQLVTGTSTKVSPAGTAVASNVLSGKTFINSTGQTITGTMTNRGSKTFTPSASKQTGAAGYYSGITVNTDSNLVAENIVSGVSIFGVTGTASSIKYATGSGPMVGVTGGGFGITVSNLDFTPTHVYGYALYSIGSVTNIYVGSLVIVDGNCRAICYGNDSSFSYDGIKTNGFSLPLLDVNLSTVPDCTCYWTAIG